MDEQTRTEPDPAKEPRRRARRAYDALLLRAHVEHHTVEAICAATGLSRSTVQRWRRDPQNTAEVQAARGDVVRGALASLRNGLGAAARRLVLVVEKSERDDVAVRAAVAMFEAHGRLSERTDLEQRLGALEAAVRQVALGPTAVSPSVRRSFRTLLGPGADFSQPSA